VNTLTFPLFLSVHSTFRHSINGNGLIDMPALRVLIRDGFNVPPTELSEPLLQAFVNTVRYSALSLRGHSERA
jgi:hypothetical protein